MEYSDKMIKARIAALELILMHGSVKAAAKASGVNKYTIKRLADGVHCEISDANLIKLGIDVSTRIDRMMGAKLHDLLLSRYGSRVSACEACYISHPQLSNIQKGRAPQFQVRKRIEKIVFGKEDAASISAGYGAWVPGVILNSRVIANLSANGLYK